MSNRHMARSIVMQCLYQWDFKGRPTAALSAIVKQNLKEFGGGLDDNAKYVKDTVDAVIDNIEKLDKISKQKGEKYNSMEEFDEAFGVK